MGLRKTVRVVVAQHTLKNKRSANVADCPKRSSGLHNFKEEREIFYILLSAPVRAGVGMLIKKQQ